MKEYFLDIKQRKMLAYLMYSPLKPLLFLFFRKNPFCFVIFEMYKCIKCSTKKDFESIHRSNILPFRLEKEGQVEVANLEF